MTPNDDDLVTIDRFIFIAEAEVARATLEAAGIDAVLADENIVRMAWGEAQAHGGVRLQVRRSEAEAAAEVLGAESVQEVVDDERDADDVQPAEPLPPGGETCRRCGSEEVFPVVSRTKAYAKAILLSIFGAVIINMGMCTIAVAGFDPPMRAAAAMYFIVLAAPFVAMIVTRISPLKRCRKCSAEWRGEQRTS